MKGHLLHNIIDNENATKSKQRLKLILPPNEQGNGVLGLTY
jgi:hypothetical protein